MYTVMLIYIRTSIPARRSVPPDWLPHLSLHHPRSLFPQLQNLLLNVDSCVRPFFLNLPQQHVDDDEGARPPNTSTAVDGDGPRVLLGVLHLRLSLVDILQEAEYLDGILRHPVIRPRLEVVVEHSAWREGLWRRW